MSLKTSISMVKIAAVIFGSAAVVLGVKYYQGFTRNHRLKETIQLDKKNHTSELNEIFSRYDSELLKNKKLLESRTQNFKAISESKKIIYKTILRNNYILKTEENENLLKKIDSLKVLLSAENEQKQLLKGQVNSLIAKNKDLQNQNLKNESLVSLNRNLTATNVYANGIKIVSNNIIETKRFNKTEQIKVCFTLLENKATVKGTKDIFIQIINPKQVVINKEDDFAEIGDKFLHYSAKTNVYYDNEELDVCVFVDSNRKDILKGDYDINIFSGTKLIGNTTFSLK
jgi:Tfp pilus assembly major pilin PilA